MSEADILLFDFTHLYETINEYNTELMSLLENTRETTEIENKIINAGGYAVGEDPTKKYKIPSLKDEVPFLDFSQLQNAMIDLKKSADSLKAVTERKVKNGTANASFNKALYTAEQQLLLENGLPRRGWYRHSIYAPGFYTGYGVKTMPGIREAIEQRNWEEAQQEIAAAAATIKKLSDYLLAAATK